jgi:two-component system response regulator HydG
MPLRERTEDIPGTMRYILDRISLRTTVAYAVSEEFLTAMIQYSWPGNVRELENALEYACSRCSSGSLSLQNLPLEFQEFGSRSHGSSLEKQNFYRETADLTMIEVEKRMILLALDDAQGDKTQAARRLGIGKTTLYRKIKEYGLDAEKDGRP